MGCSASTQQTAVVVEDQSTGVTTSNVKKPVEVSTPEISVIPPTVSPSHSTLVQPLSTSLSKIAKGYTKGYSSGDSSGDESDEFSSSPISTQTRQRNGTLCQVDLTSLKSSLHAGGDLHGRVIRMETPFGKPIDEIYDGVHTGTILGSGVSGTVRQVTHRATGIQYAVKTMDLGLISSEVAVNQLREEIFIMCQLDHPNIVRLEEVYEGLSEIFLVMELCLGGDLFDRLDEEADYHYTEAQCARLIKQMLSSLRYLHSKNIIHRDLKLENFLFSSSGTDSVLKMIDFGLSKHFSFGEIQHDSVGTPYTVAPETIRGSYDEKCDIWAIGVITYLLLSGETPFGGVDGENLLVVRDNILKGALRFKPQDIWENVSDTAKDFVKKCLQPDIKRRPTAKQAQRNMWIQTYSKKETGEGATRLKANVVKALLQFKEYSDMRKLLCEVLSFTLLPEQITDLSEEFEKLDNGDGEISLSDLKLVLLETAEAGSLGALTEAEVEGIFDALRVRKSETKIRWHEFIAAGLSQCKVDERNLTLAFERLDTDRKGFIAFENILDMLGDSCENKGDLKRMWKESIRHVNGHMDRITLDQFLIIMKGQALSDPSISTRKMVMDKHRSVKSLSSVQEGMPSPQAMRSAADLDRFERSAGLNIPHLPSLENVPITVVEIAPTNSTLSDVRPDYSRLRSRSLETIRSNLFDGIDFENEAVEEPHRRYIRSNLLTHGRNTMKLEKVVKDESMTPLMVNRALYRAHRELRLAVMDASKRFEEKQKTRNNQRREGHGNEVDTLPLPALVMRRGTIASETGLSTESKDEDNTDEQLNSASQRGGRTNRNRRKKTVSDMTGLMNAVH